MKKSVLVVALVCIIAAIVGIMFIACASGEKSEAASPDKEKAVALFDEVNGLRGQFLKQGKDVTQEPYGRAESIYELSRIYMEKKMYTEALPGLEQAKKYYEGFLK